MLGPYGTAWRPPLTGSTRRGGDHAAGEGHGDIPRRAWPEQAGGGRNRSAHGLHTAPRTSQASQPGPREGRGQLVLACSGAGASRARGNHEALLTMNVAEAHVRAHREWRSTHGPPGKYNELPNLHAPTVVAALVLTVMCAPVFEELAIRGGAQSWLARRLPWPVALVLATSLFTAMHGVGPGAYNSVQLVNVFLFGLTFGLLYQATGSVAPGMVAHAGVNGAILLNTAAPVSLVLVLLDMVAVGLIGVAVLARRRRDAHAGDPYSGGIAGPPVQTWESQAAAGPNPPLEARMESWSPSPTSRRCWPPPVPYPPN